MVGLFATKQIKEYTESVSRHLAAFNDVKEFETSDLEWLIWKYDIHFANWVVQQFGVEQRNQTGWASTPVHRTNCKKHLLWSVSSMRLKKLTFAPKKANFLSRTFKEKLNSAHFCRLYQFMYVIKWYNQLRILTRITNAINKSIAKTPPLHNETFFQKVTSFGQLNQVSYNGLCLLP